MSKMSKTLGMLAVLTGVLVVAASAPAADVFWKPGVTGDWSTPTNWVGDTLPVPGDWPRIDNGGSIQITSDVNLPGSNIWTYNTDWSILQTGGTVTANALYQSNPKAGPNGIYRLESGGVDLNIMLLAWNNTSNALGHFVQAGGSVDLNQLQMCIKSSTQIGKYDLEKGDFTASLIKLGQSGANQTAVFTQSGGTATLSGGITLGAVAGTTGESIYNLDGGELTITGATPFTFSQPGAPVYFDFDGGTLNLPGTWDFATLTGIANADFRAFGVAAIAGDLAFTPITIGQDAYTAINARTAPQGDIPEPATMALLGLAVCGLGGYVRRRKA